MCFASDSIERHIFIPKYKSHENYQSSLFLEGQISIESFFRRHLFRWHDPLTPPVDPPRHMYNIHNPSFLRPVLRSENDMARWPPLETPQSQGKRVSNVLAKSPPYVLRCCHILFSSSCVVPTYGHGVLRNRPLRPTSYS